MKPAALPIKPTLDLV